MTQMVDPKLDPKTIFSAPICHKAYEKSKTLQVKSGSLVLKSFSAHETGPLNPGLHGLQSLVWYTEVALK